MQAGNPPHQSRQIAVKNQCMRYGTQRANENVQQVLYQRIGILQLALKLFLGDDNTLSVFDRFGACHSWFVVDRCHLTKDLSCTDIADHDLAKGANFGDLNNSGLHNKRQFSGLGLPSAKTQACYPMALAGLSGDGRPDHRVFLNVQGRIFFDLAVMNRHILHLKHFRINPACSPSL